MSNDKRAAWDSVSKQLDYILSMEDGIRLSPQVTKQSHIALAFWMMKKARKLLNDALNG